jgi:hypothetical protein
MDPRFRGDEVKGQARATPLDTPVAPS